MLRSRMMYAKILIYTILSKFALDILSHIHEISSKMKSSHVTHSQVLREPFKFIS